MGVMWFFSQSLVTVLGRDYGNYPAKTRRWTNVRLMLTLSQHRVTVSSTLSTRLSICSPSKHVTCSLDMLISRRVNFKTTHFTLFDLWNVACNTKCHTSSKANEKGFISFSAIFPKSYMRWVSALDRRGYYYSCMFSNDFLKFPIIELSWNLTFCFIFIAFYRTVYIWTNTNANTSSKNPSYVILDWMFTLC